MPAPSKQLRALLAEGDARTLGRVEEVLALLEPCPALAGELLGSLADPEAEVRMRAADALEKFSRGHASWLQPFAHCLLELAERGPEAQVLWHLFAILPRLRLDPEQRARAVQVLERGLEGRSSICRTEALQALFQISAADPALRVRVCAWLEQAQRTGTAAMRARSRKLLAAMRVQP